MVARLARFVRCVAIAYLLGQASGSATSHTEPLDDQPDATRQTWETMSRDGLFKLAFGPRTGNPIIGKFQVWELSLTTSDGQPVFPARFAIGGGMQGHGHGLPTQPKVTGYTAERRYVIEGLKFNMAGDWTLLFAIEARLPGTEDMQSDQAQIDLTVDY
jgi:hypothetical protein